MHIDREAVVRTLLRDRVRLLAYICVIVRDEHLAEDIFQEVSLLAVRKFEQIADESHLHRWLRQAARTAGLQALRNRRRRIPTLDVTVLDALEGHWDRETDSPSADAAEALRRCLDRLGATARRLLDLRYGEGLRVAEVAERVGRKVETVYVGLSRAHQAFGGCVRKRLAIEAR